MTVKKFEPVPPALVQVKVYVIVPDVIERETVWLPDGDFAPLQSDCAGTAEAVHPSPREGSISEALQVSLVEPPE